MDHSKSIFHDNTTVQKQSITENSGRENKSVFGHFVSRAVCLNRLIHFSKLIFKQQNASRTKTSPKCGCCWSAIVVREYTRTNKATTCHRSSRQPACRRQHVCGEQWPTLSSSTVLFQRPHRMFSCYDSLGRDFAQSNFLNHLWKKKKSLKNKILTGPPQHMPV